MNDRDHAVNVLALLADGRRRRVDEIANGGYGGVGARTEDVRIAIRELLALEAIESEEGGVGRSRATLYGARLGDSLGPQSRTDHETHVAAQSLVATARSLRDPALTPKQRWLIAVTEQAGQPLDPCHFDGAAILLRAETLFEQGQPVTAALTTARTEFAASCDAEPSLPHRSATYPRPATPTREGDQHDRQTSRRTPRRALGIRRIQT